jgi:Amt family ammonium transporter
LWFGWFGFNAGSALGASAVQALGTTTVAAAAGMALVFLDKTLDKLSAMGVLVL